ncbi:MAG: CBS domain-containing protein [Planctomycetes bacterium]|nr:CBS domain-containing protein [Planctomycetota bacterium]
MLKAKDIMNENIVSVTKDTPLIEAARIMARNNISGIPVVDDRMVLEGVITEKDILALFDVMQYEESRTVNTTMTHDVISFDVDDLLLEICDCLKEHEFRRVPVTEEGKLVGIISRRDLMNHIVKQREMNVSRYS